MHDKCVAGDVALVAGEQTLYRNKHCAVCNEENILGCGPRLLDVSGENSPVQVADFYLTINFRHQSQSNSYFVNYICPEGVYDCHLKACVNPNHIVAPIHAVLDKYIIAIWFSWPYSICDRPNVTHVHNCFTDAEPVNILNAKFCRREYI